VEGGDSLTPETQIKLFNYEELWKVAGPIIISGILILIIGLVFSILLSRMKSGIFKELTRGAMIVALIGIFYFAIITTAEIWANR